MFVGNKHSAQRHGYRVQHQCRLVRKEADSAERTSRVSPKIDADITQETAEGDSNRWKREHARQSRHDREGDYE